VVRHTDTPARLVGVIARRIPRRGRGLCVLAALVLLATPRHSAADADALWRIVGDRCIPDQQQNGSPKPCELVDLVAGYAVLKDLVGDTQFLVIPTVRVSGIDSPEILAPNAPNYWEGAWQARGFVNARAHRELPRDVISLAINSVSGRTQDQLHIHVDCVRRDVQATLQKNAKDIGAHWTALPVKLSGHDYQAMRIDQPDLSRTNPFVLLADGIAGARADMAHYTLVVVGESSGFVLLAGHASPLSGDSGSGEELQDHACAAAH
jgi:CDP-diacylglycerol pyrophosphatase